MLYVLPLSSVLICFSGIVDDNETGSPSDVFGASLSFLELSSSAYTGIPGVH